MESGNFSQLMQQMPLVAILRGITPKDVEQYANILINAGYRIIEVPLTSPDAYNSIEILASMKINNCIIGAGTVTSSEQVEKVEHAGGKIIVMPHTDSEVITRTKELGLLSMPGCYTPSEAFSAIKQGADALKLFPADTLGVKGFKALSVVLPNIPVLPVGGIKPDASSMEEYLNAGAAGFGLGSGLYKAGISAQQLEHNALAYIDAFRQAQSKIETNRHKVQ